MEERILRINIRKDLIKKPNWKRKKLYLPRLREKLKRILKVDEVIISNKVNEYIHSFSNKNLPYKLTLKILKEEKVAKVDLA
ncbi:MAG: 50S ribosomal protein L31e [Candidatus Aenigmatarchaeota archaeon]